MKFRVVIPAAGYGKRFQAAGYDTIKPDLRIRYRNQTKRLIDWAVDRLPEEMIGPIVVAKHPLVIGPETPHASVTVHRSRGQAHAMACALDATTPREHADVPVLVINCDVVFVSSDLRSVMQAVVDGADAGILVIESSDPRYSYAEPFPYAYRFAEKRVIGNNAMAGAWAFRSSRQLRAALDQVCQNHNEPYLSGALNFMKGIFQCARAKWEVLDWGTPEGIEASGAKILETRTESAATSTADHSSSE